MEVVNNKDKHYRLSDGTLVRVIMLGVNYFTGEEMLVLREVGANKNWMINSHQLHERMMVDGQIVNTFEPDEEADRDFAAGKFDFQQRTQDSYPGDARGDLRPKIVTKEVPWYGGNFAHINRNGRFKP